MMRAAPTRWPAPVGVVAAVALVAGCTVEQGPYTTDADAGSAHALVSIERSVVRGSLEEARAEAFAGFLQAPPEADPAAVLKLTGLARDLPAEGQCATGRDRERSIPLAPLSNVELLDVGDLNVEANGSSVALAPRAFPTVTDLVSGVVYTTRDRAADRLPPASRYRISASGGQLGPFTAEAEAPDELEGVSVNDVPLEELAAVSARSALALSWLPGEARDIVYVEITGDGGLLALQCAFRDDAGGALIPPGLVPGAGSGTIGIHRLRSVDFARRGLARAELRFDFEAEAEVTFGE